MCTASFFSRLLGSWLPPQASRMLPAVVPRSAAAGRRLGGSVLLAPATGQGRRRRPVPPATAFDGVYGFASDPFGSFASDPVGAFASAAIIGTFMLVVWFFAFLALHLKSQKTNRRQAEARAKAEARLAEARLVEMRKRSQERIKAMAERSKERWALRAVTNRAAQGPDACGGSHGDS